MSKPKLVCISWYDHSAYDGGSWHDRKKIENLTPVFIKTVGWIVKETKKYYVVVSSWSDLDHMQGDFCILKGTVKSIKELH